MCWKMAVKGRPNLTLQRLIKDTYCLHVCTSTVSLCLHDMGFSYKQFSKGVYFDGHEHKDVVEERGYGSFFFFFFFSCRQDIYSICKWLCIW